MDNNKERLSINIAKLYYESDYSQQQIAEKLNISRPTVSRLLQYAKDQKFVRINIVDPIEDNSSLEQMLISKYNLDDVKIAYTPLDTRDEITKSISAKAAEYLYAVTKDGDIIGVSWGLTIYNVALKLRSKSLKGVQIVQLKGGVSHSQSNTYAYEVVELFSESFNTVGRYLPLPLMFDSVQMKKLVENDRHIKRILELGRQANIAVFTVGTVKDDALLFRLGYIDEKDKRILKEDAVGDICSRFFNAEGELCNKELDNRTVGINLEELKNKEKRILVAGSQRKISAIKAALAGGFANILVTDQYTAHALIK
ncbi:sugar-binding transcriptional regulator [Pectinatus haikarae]|uniref:Deoxyribonucleoside regulator n=1 Tax=Pectinatus haikarae TaxID=349096 RepID=A0ABT9Y5B6_9FIRM|nr:sugar-binding transcriptional regulator [Pectinatus haikarae]MDQ0203030.1 deoxyribonucleoside regulator [Pectinatus haikarae]